MRLIPRLVAVLLLVLLSIPISGYGPPTLIESESAETPVSSTILRQMKAATPPAILAEAAVVIDADTGYVIFEKNAHDRRAPASITKMMTALVTLSGAELDEVVEAGPAVYTVEPTIIGLDPGDRLTIEQMLHGLLLNSGNDAAVALAEHVGGSISSFATMMNARATQLGLTDTQFQNPHGLDQDGHYSSAYDLAMIAREALRNPTFERIVSTREYRISGPPAWLFRSSNRLLDLFDGADGIKTGYTDDAGRCLAFSATRDGRRAISVVLNSENQWGDSASLLGHFFASYRWDTLDLAGSPLLSYEQAGEMRQVAVKARPEILFPMWQRTYLRWFVDLRGGSSSADGVAGAASYYLFGTKAGEIELVGLGSAEASPAR